MQNYFYDSFVRNFDFQKSNSGEKIFILFIKNADSMKSSKFNKVNNFK